MKTPVNEKNEHYRFRVHESHTSCTEPSASAEHPDDQGESHDQGDEAQTRENPAR
jgi:hypothetical protein